MARVYKYDWAVDMAGNALVNPDALVTVRLRDSTTLAALFATNEAGGNSPKANPFVSSNGFWDFWAESGGYDVTVVDQKSPQRIGSRTVPVDLVSGRQGGITHDMIAPNIPGSMLLPESVGSDQIEGEAIGLSELSSILKPAQVLVPSNAPVASQTFGSLDGEVARAYRIFMVGNVNLAAADRLLTVRPNGISAANDSDGRLHRFGRSNAGSEVHSIEPGLSQGLLFSPVLQNESGQSTIFTADLTLFALDGQRAQLTGYSAYQHPTSLFRYRYDINTHSVAVLPDPLTSVQVNFGGGTFNGLVSIEPLRRV